MTQHPNAKFCRFGWGVVVYNLFVIVWGAFVRATGSGAGCGSHWPLCNGVAVPRDPTTATLIEFTHRLTSGLALLAVVALVVWAYRAFPKGSWTRKAAVASLVLILIEALLGAGLVLLEYVEMNKSVGRAVYLCAHLTNTLLLVGALVSTAWLGGRPGGTPRTGSDGKRIRAGLWLALLVSVTGAIAALGDTLYPAISLLQGVKDEFSQGAPALLRLRLFHPVFACLAGAYLLWMASALLRKQETPAAKALLGLVLVQLLAGLINVLLLAPVWMQLLHLGLGNLLWIALVVLLLTDAFPTAVPARTKK
jgi:cytochrome c oxidase assembly protein subunit 15